MSHRSVQRSDGKFLALPAIFFLLLFIASYTSIKPLRTSLPYEHVTNLTRIRRERSRETKKKKNRMRKKKGYESVESSCGCKAICSSFGLVTDLYFLDSNQVSFLLR